MNAHKYSHRLSSQFEVKLPNTSPSVRHSSLLKSACLIFIICRTVVWNVYNLSNNKSVFPNKSRGNTLSYLNLFLFYYLPLIYLSNENMVVHVLRIAIDFHSILTNLFVPLVCLTWVVELIQTTIFTIMCNVS